MDRGQAGSDDSVVSWARRSTDAPCQLPADIRYSRDADATEPRWIYRNHLAGRNGDRLENLPAVPGAYEPHPRYRPRGDSHPPLIRGIAVAECRLIHREHTRNTHDTLRCTQHRLSLTSVLVIALGYVLRRTGLLTREHGNVLARIVINVTLPAVILRTLPEVELSLSLVFFPLLHLNWVTPPLHLLPQQSSLGAVLQRNEAL